MSTIIYPGTRFGNLIATNPVEPSPEGRAQWLCQCKCGGTVIADANRLRRGRVRSCGCPPGAKGGKGIAKD